MSPVVRLDCVSCRDGEKPCKLLRCLHSLCMGKCLEAHTGDDNTVECPLCGKVTSTPPGAILADYLPNSREFAKNEDTPANATLSEKGHACESCVEETSASAFCKDCRKRFCSLHAQVHPNSHGSYGHDVVPLLEDGTLGEKEMADSGPRCSMHPSSRQSYYCLACRMILCEKGLASKRHAAHRDELQPLSQAASTIRKSIIPNMLASFSDDSRIAKTLTETDDKLSTLHANNIQVTSEITGFFAGLKTLVEKRERELLGKLDGLQTEYRQALQEHKQQLVASQEAGQEVIRLASACNNNIEFVKAWAWLEEAGNDLMAAAERIAEPLAPGMVFFRPDLKEDCEEVIPDAGFVSKTDVMSVRDTSMSAPDCVLKGEPLFITVIPRNEFGGNVVASSDHMAAVNIAVDAPAMGVTECSLTSFRSKRRGGSTIVGRFETMTAEGQLTVSTTLGNRHVAGSPAIVTIAQQAVFDHQRCDPGLVVSNYNRTITHSDPSGGTRCASGMLKWRAGRHDVDIRIDRLTKGSVHHLFSVCNNHEDPTGDFQTDGIYGWYGNSRDMISESTGTALGQPWRVGDIIHLSVDCDKHTLYGRHVRTGAEQTLTDVRGDLCLFVSLSCYKDQVTILDLIV
eukprot:scpid45205/ scgid24721/ 